MKLRSKLIQSAAIGIATVGFATTATAGGFDRGGVNIDLLFDDSTFAADSSVTYVNVNRNRKDIVRAGNGVTSSTGTATRETSDSSYWNTRGAAKVAIGDHVDCVGTVGQAFGAKESNGTGQVMSASVVDFEIKTMDYGLTCGVKKQLGKGQARLIAGGSMLDFDGSLTRQSYLFSTPLVAVLYPGLDANGIGSFKLSDQAFGWRVGASYEIPEIAFRAAVIYNSKYNLDLSGTVDTTGFGTATGGVYDISASTQMPQSLEVKLQSGINQKTLAFANIKWQDWSQLQSIAISPFTSPTPTGAAPNSTVAFEPFYRDGLTITGGLGRKLTDNITAGAALTWDRGTKTTSGTQTATWTLSSRVTAKMGENFEASLGGALGYLTAGNSGPNTASIDSSGNVTYNFDGEWFQAINASFKLKF